MLVLCHSLSIAQDVKNPEAGYYMVVAAYGSSAEGYAQRFTETMQARGHETSYAYFPVKKMYFVYTQYFKVYNAAIAEINPTRSRTNVEDAWVYIYAGGGEVAEEKTGAPAEDQSNAEEQPAEEEKLPNEEIDKTGTEAVESVDSIRIITKNQEKEVIPEVNENAKLIYFEALDARTQEPVEVSIELKNSVSGRSLGEMAARETKKFVLPEDASPTVQVSVNTFGWVADAVYFDFDRPINDSTDYFLREQGDTLIILFDMHRMRKGDVEVLYNVYFIPDASLMRPVSEAQLIELQSMLVENEQMNIKLHGHTNGNARGEYFRLSEEDTIFFALNRQHEKTNGSAKQLSYDRANTIKRYLVHHGIAEDRIEVVGWGGKRMIYDKMSKAASRNIRVEVEIVE